MFYLDSVKVTEHDRSERLIWALMVMDSSKGELVKPGVGYIPTWPGANVGFNPTPDSGVHAGLAVYMRAGVDTGTGLRKEIPVYGDLWSLALAHGLALGWELNEHDRNLNRLNVTRLLIDILTTGDLRPEELRILEAHQTQFAQGLPDRPVDRDMVELVDLAQRHTPGIIDSRGRINLGRTAAIETAKGRRASRRDVKVRQAINAIDRRRPYILLLWREHWENHRALVRFFTEHATLADGLEQFEQLFPALRFQPQSRLASWLWGTLEAGTADQEEVAQAARLALQFQVRQEEWLRLIRPLSSLTVARAERNSEQLQRTFLRMSGGLVERLGDVELMGPFVAEHQGLLEAAASVDRALVSVQWDRAIKSAKAFKQLYFGGADDSLWYSHAPESARPDMQGGPPRVLTGTKQPDDPFEGLPM
jgi:hypothetical protein